MYMLSSIRKCISRLVRSLSIIVSWQYWPSCRLNTREMRQGMLRNTTGIELGSEASRSTPSTSSQTQVTNYLLLAFVNHAFNLWMSSQYEFVRPIEITRRTETIIIAESGSVLSPQAFVQKEPGLWRSLDLGGLIIPIGTPTLHRKLYISISVLDCLSWNWQFCGRSEACPSLAMSVWNRCIHNPNKVYVYA